jgi:hypothetical protein
VLDLRLDQKIDGASGCLHRIAARAQGDTMVLCTACCTARLYTQCGPSLSGLCPKAELGTHGIGLYSILFQNGTLIRPASTSSLLTAVARLFRGIDLCRSESMEAGSMEEAGSGHEDSSHNILTLDALQVLSRSQ